MTARTAQAADGAAADLVVVAGAVRTFEPGGAAQGPPVTALAVRDGRVVALAREAAELEALVGPETTVVSDRGLTVLPSFTDTHNHLVLAARNVLGVPVSQARDIPGFLSLVRDRARRTPPGEWVRTAVDWHETQLAEGRLPTARELDTAAPDHPVLALRGGHNAVLNSAALRLAGIGPDTPDIPGGFIARDAEGRPTGWLQDAALDHAQRRVPALRHEELSRGLTEAAGRYAALGLGTVRDPAVSPDEWRTYLATDAEVPLAVRSHPMIFTTEAAVRRAGSMDAYLDGLEARDMRPGAGTGRVRLWGLKLVLDGGVEAAALHEPYADRPGYRGELLWEPDALTEALAAAARRGWPVGTHAFGDRAVGVLVDAVREVVRRHGPVRPGLLAIEHGGLSGERVADIAALGVHVTAQHALLDGLAPALVPAWGAERAARLFPLRALLDAGARVSAGTDHPIGPLAPLRCVHGMVTRGTTAGVLGAEHAVTREEALRLYTSGGADLLGPAGAGGATGAGGPAGGGGDTAGGGAPVHGTLAVGSPADLALYPADPLTCPLEALPDLAPALTVLGGRVVHDEVA